MNNPLAGLLMPLADAQRRVLNFLWAFYQANDQLPNSTVLAGHFGWSSRNAARDYLNSLEKKGYVERNTVQWYRFTPEFHAEQKRLRGEGAE